MTTDTDPYRRYIHHKQAGRKREATAAIQDLIASRARQPDRDEWARAFLEAGDFGHRIRHELYAALIFPALLDGYVRQDWWSVYWLARTSANLYADPALHRQVDLKSQRQLLREAHTLHPVEEIRESLIRAYIDEFEYCQHEWPVGLLAGMDAAEIVDCDDLLRDVEFVRSLDNEDNAEFLREFASRVAEYRARLVTSSRAATD